MGIIVNAGAMVGEVQTINAALSAVKEAIAACASAIGNFVGDGSLTGNAYSGARWYFSSFSPAFDALNAQIDSVINGGANALSVLGSCPDLGYANEDALRAEKEKLIKLRQEYEYTATHAYYTLIVDGELRTLTDEWLKSYYISLISKVDARLKKIDSILKQLQTFNGCSAFAGIGAACDALKKSIGAICSSGAIFVDGAAEHYQNRMMMLQQQKENLQSLNKVNLGGIYGYGILLLNGEEYSIYVPDGERWQDDKSWQAVGDHSLTNSKHTNWGEFLVNLFSGTTKIKSDPVYAGSTKIFSGSDPSLNASGIAAGVTAIMFLVSGFNAYAGAREESYVKAYTQEKDGQKRVIIVAGDSKTKERYDSIADGKPHHYMFDSTLEQEMACEAAKVRYYGIKYGYNKPPASAFFEHYELEYTFDQQHQGSGDVFYIWKAQDGTTIAKPISYPDDHFTYIKTGTLHLSERDKVDEQLSDMLVDSLEQPALNGVWEVLNQGSV